MHFLEALLQGCRSSCTCNRFRHSRFQNYVKLFLHVSLLQLESGTELFE